MYVVLTLVLVLAGCAPKAAETPGTTTTIKVTPSVTATATAQAPATTATQPPKTTTTPPATKTDSPPATTALTWPTSFYTPTAATFQPTGTLAELFQFMLSLINEDRQQNGLPPVALRYNAAAQKHAQDMLDNYYLSHWGTDGLKPYMRYTIEGGLNNEGENSSYSGWYDPGEDAANYAPIDAREELRALQWGMMNADEASNWGHRDTILNKWYTHVSLGIAYNNKRLTLVQQFEGRYFDYYSPPIITGSTLTMSGKLNRTDLTINNISIFFDPLPQPLTHAKLTRDPDYTDGYGLGERVATIVPPAPPGQTYSNLSSDTIIAGKWDTGADGQFSIQANINPALAQGKGVYTIGIIAEIGDEAVNLANYSIFIK